MKAQISVGANHIRAMGNLVGDGLHFIQLNATQSNVDQSTNGYGLHIGGVIVINDR